MIFKAVDEARNIVKTAILTTRSARRHNARIQENKKIQSSRPSLDDIRQKNINSPVKPFDNIEIW